MIQVYASTVIDAPATNAPATTPSGGTDKAPWDD